MGLFLKVNINPSRVAAGQPREELIAVDSHISEGLIGPYGLTATSSFNNQQNDGNLGPSTYYHILGAEGSPVICTAGGQDRSARLLLHPYASRELSEDQTEGHQLIDLTDWESEAGHQPLPKKPFGFQALHFKTGCRLIGRINCIEYHEDRTVHYCPITFPSLLANHHQLNELATFLSSNSSSNPDSNAVAFTATCELSHYVLRTTFPKENGLPEIVFANTNGYIPLPKATSITLFN